MTLQPLLEASLPIQIHTVTAVAALVLGALVLRGRKGTRGHRAAGRVWMALMVVTALSSFFINGFQVIGPFSPIHLLSVVILVSAPRAIAAARAGRIDEHRSTVRGMYAGLVIAGLLTLLPGRLSHEVILGREFELDIGWSVLFLPLAIAATVAWLIGRAEKRQQEARRER